MIFPVLETEDLLQVDDRTRISGLKTFLSPDEAAITLIEIEPEAGAGFFDVTADRYLDWQYATDGTKTITLRVTTDALPTTKTKDISVITAVDDKLFSSDADLLAHEDDLLNYVRSGRNSFLDKHRLSQQYIVRWLGDNRIYDFDGNRLTKDALTDLEEVAEWSKFYTLYLIFNSLSNAIDDIFAEKALLYKTLADNAQNRSVISLDRSGDGIEDQKKDLRTHRMIRR